MSEQAQGRVADARAQVDPRGCARNVLDVHGAAGAAWLRGLPDLVADCAVRWGVAILPPFGRLSFNYVTPAVRADGTPAVLKAGVPGAGLTAEWAALRAFEGEGMARLLESDPERGLLLLERLLPGTPLSHIEDEDEVTRVAAGILRRLWRPAPAGQPFACIAGWAAGLGKLHSTFADGYGPFPRALVDRAEGLFRELLAIGRPPVLLHGDLHAQNILRAEREPWLAIDPKGVVGDPYYDVADFVCSVPEVPDAAERQLLLARRIARVAEMLEMDRQELTRWALAQAVLSGWWSYEDHGRGWEGAFALAEQLAGL